MVMIDFHRIPEKMTGRHAENPLWVLVHVVSYKVYPALAGLVLSHLRPRESSSRVLVAGYTPFKHHNTPLTYCKNGSQDLLLMVFCTVFSSF